MTLFHVLKVNSCTFDQCLKYKTDQAQEAKKMEKLNNIFFALMARGPDGMSYLKLLLIAMLLDSPKALSLTSMLVKLPRAHILLRNVFKLLSCFHVNLT